MNSSTVITIFSRIAIVIGVFFTMIGIIKFITPDVEDKAKGVRNIISGVLLITAATIIPTVFTGEENIQKSPASQTEQAENTYLDKEEINDLHDTDNNDEIKTPPSKTKHFAN